MYWTVCGMLELWFEMNVGKYSMNPLKVAPHGLSDSHAKAVKMLWLLFVYMCVIEAFNFMWKHWPSDIETKDNLFLVNATLALR